MHFKITHSSTGQQPDKFSADLNCRPYCCRYVWLFYYLSSQRRRASSDHRLLGDDKCSFPLSVNATPKVMYTSGMVFLLYTFFFLFFFILFWLWFKERQSIWVSFLLRRSLPSETWPNQQQCRLLTKSNISKIHDLYANIHVCFCGVRGGTRLLYCLFCMNTNTVET